jgi:hypothetical protein
LTPDLKAISLLINSKKIKDNYSSENIAVIVFSILYDFELIDRIRYFISNNVFFDYFAIDALYKEFKLANLIKLRLEYL